MVERTQVRCDELKESLQSQGHLPQENLVWSLNDSDAVSLHIENMISTAKQNLRVKAAASTLERHIPSMRNAARRGVKALIILYGDDIKQFEIGRNRSVYRHEGD